LIRKAPAEKILISLSHWERVGVRAYGHPNLIELTSARYRTESGSDRNKKASYDNTAGFYA